MKKNINRREFLKRTTGIATSAIAFPYFVPSSVLGRVGTVAPSNRIVMGSIGLGTQGTGLMRGFLGHKDVQVIAVVNDHLHWYTPGVLILLTAVPPSEAGRELLVHRKALKSVEPSVGELEPKL